MAKTRYRTATVDLGNGESVLVPPEKDLPEGVSDSDLNPKVFTPWTETDAGADFTNYDDMKVPALMKMAKDRGLSPESHKKADLVAALEEDDASDE